MKDRQNGCKGKSKIYNFFKFPLAYLLISRFNIAFPTLLIYKF